MIDTLDPISHGDEIDLKKLKIFEAEHALGAYGLESVVSIDTDTLPIASTIYQSPDGNGGTTGDRDDDNWR